MTKEQAYDALSKYIESIGIVELLYTDGDTNKRELECSLAEIYAVNDVLSKLVDSKPQITGAPITPVYPYVETTDPSFPPFPPVITCEKGPDCFLASL